MSKSKQVPIAPPVYRPQPVPKVLQTKKAVAPPPFNQPKRATPAPPVYRPQPPPRVAQRKTDARSLAQSRVQPGPTPKAPPVYHPPQASRIPQLKKVVQPKPADRLPAVKPPVIIPTHRKQASRIAQAKPTGAIQRKRFEYKGRTYVGIDPADCQAFMAAQADKGTCWASVLSNAQALLGTMPAGEEQIIKWANEALGKGTSEDMTYMIAEGATPSSYQELINIMKERTGIKAHRVAWSKENTKAIFDHVYEHEKPVIIGNEADEAHVVILLAFGTEGGVLFYDTAEGYFREASHATFQSNNLKTAFLMDKV